MEQQSAEVGLNPQRCSKVRFLKRSHWWVFLHILAKPLTLWFSKNIQERPNFSQLTEERPF